MHEAIEKLDSSTPSFSEAQTSQEFGTECPFVTCRSHKTQRSLGLDEEVLTPSGKPFS